ncbi:hypothetical protein ABBQ32_012698 [Trebouxia sp. C0010 RCD-2024]
MSESLLLYSRAVSSASYRVRIALHLKQQRFDVSIIDEKQQRQKGSDYLDLNPQSLIPLLIHKSAGREVKLNQSLAIMEYLQDTFPQQGTALLPADVLGRARARSLALHIACEMQPLNNSCVVKHLQTDLKADAATAKAWQVYWATKGFSGLEKELESTLTGQFCHGDSPTIADCCLVPQVFRCTLPRVGLNLDDYPQIKRIYNNCLKLPEVQKAMPQQQPDAPDAGFLTALYA